MGFFLTDHPHPTLRPRLFSSLVAKTTAKSSTGRKGFISTYSLQGITDGGQEFVSGPDLVPSFFSLLLLFSCFGKNPWAVPSPLSQLVQKQTTRDVELRALSLIAFL